MRVNHRFIPMETTIRFGVDSGISMGYRSHRSSLWHTTNGLLGHSGRTDELLDCSGWVNGLLGRSPFFCSMWRRGSSSFRTPLSPLTSEETNRSRNHQVAGGLTSFSTLSSLAGRRDDRVRRFQMPKDSDERWIRRWFRKGKGRWRTAAEERRLEGAACRNRGGAGRAAPEAVEKQFPSGNRYRAVGSVLNGIRMGHWAGRAREAIWAEYGSGRFTPRRFSRRGGPSVGTAHCAAPRRAGVQWEERTRRHGASRSGWPRRRSDRWRQLPSFGLRRHSSYFWNYLLLIFDEVI